MRFFYVFLCFSQGQPKLHFRGAAALVAAMTAQDAALRAGSILQKKKQQTEKLLGNHLGKGAIIVV